MNDGKVEDEIMWEKEVKVEETKEKIWKLIFKENRMSSNKVNE